MKKLIYISISLFSLISCETLVKDFEIRKPEDKITMLGWALADSFPAFFLTPNLSIDDSLYFPAIQGADVGLYLNGERISTLELNDSGWYSATDYQFEAGNEYIVRASAEGYPDVNAEITVPSTPVITRIDTTLFAEIYPECPDCEPSYNLEIEIDFINDPNIDDYYSIEVNEITECYDYEYYYTSCISSRIYDPLYIFANLPIIESVREYEDSYYNPAPGEEAYGTALYFSDKQFVDGENTLVFSVVIGSYMYNTDPRMVFIFKKIDEAMFQYVQSKGRTDEGGNPFIQPVSIYSNVSNGLGLVSGASQYIQIFDMSGFYLEDREE